MRGARCGGTPYKKEKGEYGGRDSLEKGKYQANSYTAARVKGLERGRHISMNGRLIFSEEFIFRWRGHRIVVASALKGGGEAGGKKIHGVGGTQSSLSQLGQTLVCVVTGLKRSMNYNMLWKIYKKRILTLQEKALLHR